MIRALRFLVSVALFTAWYGGRAIIGGWRGVRGTPGGIYDEVSRGFGRSMLRWNRIEVVVEGWENLTEGQPYVFVSNHASFVDIWVLLALLPGSVRFVFKKELERVPIFGPALKAAGHISIDRKNLGSAFAAYSEAAQTVRAGTSAMVFAEGTRSKDGLLMPFKKGPFVLAIAAQVPVVPVAVLGAWELLPKGKIAVRPGTVTLRIGKPINTTALRYEDRNDLSENCRARLLAMGVKEQQ